MVKAFCSQKCSFITMIGLTMSFFFAEIVVGYATNSMALVADSFHMLSDVLSLFVGFFALKISQQKRRQAVGKNTFGWVRAEVLGALLNSVFLVALCFSILIESLKRIVTPESIDQPILVLAIGAAGLLVNILGIGIFRGHMGHGHSHLGHAHSHKGQGDNCKSDEHSYVVHSESQGKTHIHKKCIENGHSGGKNSSSIDEPKLEQQLSRIDEAKVGSQDSELTSVVIVNKVTSRENMTDVGGKELDKSEQENPKLRASPESIAHNGSSEYKIMMNAIQANKEAIENCLHIQAEKEEIPSKSKQVVASDQMNIKGVYLHVLGDALGSVIVVCSALAIYYGSGSWTLYVDPGMSILMVAIILKSSMPLLKESSMILLQTVPTHIQIRELENRLLEQFPLVISVHEFHVWRLAGSKIVASLHLKLPTPGDYRSISESLKIFFHDEGIHSTTIQPEFIEDAKAADKTLTASNLCLLKCEDIQCQESFCCITNEETVTELNNSSSLKKPKDAEKHGSSRK